GSTRSISATTPPPLRRSSSRFSPTTRRTTAPPSNLRPRSTRPASRRRRYRTGEKALAMAQRYAHNKTGARGRARLAAPDVPSDETLMRHGLDALYTQHDPAAAAAEFRQVLARNPTHYGATFQLAAALDAAGKRAEARPLWKRCSTCRSS